MSRRAWILVALALLLAVGDLAQSAAFVRLAPALEAERVLGGDGPPTWTVLLAGEGMDASEEASTRRDLAFAARQVPRAFAGEHRLLAPGVDELPDLLETVPPEARLVLFASGHGGGRNFGGTERGNLTRDELADLLSRVRCREILAVLDACWSGEFSRSFAARAFQTPTTLVTSTDASHLAPYPTSFLSPASFGRDYFAALASSRDPAEAFAAVQESRRWLARVYPEEIGVQGTLSRYGQGDAPSRGSPD